MQVSPIGATRAGFSHHRAKLDKTDIHFVSAGTAGSPILLVHGFPETWWTFHKLMPLLAKQHRVFAVDLPGFGDSDNAPGEDHDSRNVASLLNALVQHLDMGPIHLIGQDIAGGSLFRLAAENQGDIASFTAIEMGLAGFGLESLADVTHGGAWHIGMLAAPDVPQMLLAGREAEFLIFMFKSMIANPRSVSPADIDEFARTYSRANGWIGAVGLYSSMLREGDDIRAIAKKSPLRMPVLAVGAGGGEFTAATMSQVSADDISSVILKDVGHYAALEAPDKLAKAILEFLAEVDGGS